MIIFKFFFTKILALFSSFRFFRYSIKGVDVLTQPWFAKKKKKIFKHLSSMYISMESKHIVNRKFMTV